MSNLFSVFDQTSWFNMPLNWFMIGFFVIVFPAKYWSSSPPTLSFLKFITYFLLNEFKLSLGKLNLPGMMLVPISFFVAIFVSNFSGIFPYLFTNTSHLSFTMSISFPLCMGALLLELIMSPNNFLMRLVPASSPLVLSPILVFLELISVLIRPLTLSIRLVANMTAGHLLLVLASSPLSGSSITVILPIMGGLLVLMVLESSVAIIQAYVFSALNVSYLTEVNSSYKI